MITIVIGEGIDDIRNDWAVKAVVPFETLVINLFEMIKVRLKQMVQRRVGRLARVINSSCVLTWCRISHGDDRAYFAPSL
jgi:hypothetical protein